MTTELFWLTLTLALAASLWIPFIVQVTSTADAALVDDGVPEIGSMSRTARLRHRAHLNLLEQAMPFAALILLAHMLDVSSTATAVAAAAFFWLRVAHAGVMLLAPTQMPVRPILFTLGWACAMAVVVEILRLG